MVRLATRHRFPLPLPLLALLGVLAMASPLAAQSYPSGMIRIVNGNAPGTPPDIVSRVVANDLSESEHWYVVVENKVGAIGTIGAAELVPTRIAETSAASIACSFGRSPKSGLHVPPAPQPRLRASPE